MAVFKGDKVYPTGFFDNCSHVGEIPMTIPMVFNGVLDGDKLHRALSRLMELGDWGKLGGRIRKGNGKGVIFDIHVPQPFTEDRPAVKYYKKTFNMNIKDHPLAKQLPTITEHASLQKGFHDFEPLIRHPDAPDSFKELLKTDSPITWLYIVSFNDATIVTLGVLHMLVDAGSIEAILRAWTLVLAGKEDQVPPLLGASEDILYPLSKQPDEKGRQRFPFEKLYLSTFGLILFFIRWFWLNFTTTTLTRTLYLPAARVAQLKAEAREDIALEYRGKEIVPWVSEGDVLQAWTVRMSSLAQSSPRHISCLTMVNLRRRIPELLEAKGDYIQNLIVPLFTSFTPEAARGPLGLAALKIRETLNQQATALYLLDYIRWVREKWEAGKAVSGGMVRPYNCELVPMSNWVQMNLLRTVDFSPALIKGVVPQSGNKTTSAGSPTYVMPGAWRDMSNLRGVWIVTGRDSDGNVWMSCYMTPAIAKVVEQEIASWDAVKPTQQ
ncbi:Chloramphenicol acetyltransferase-like domain protein [Moelleriella libera RCEF 2490]|uniref:Chloramphenicol acetyltransferase-like domain protein n=1 Tax=Moelleriella libera RCEF 2490 TaxID=1081109 RepID=A0A166V310_9HYPO|nr:Chloramphenicol acetyltransferase-like domain protein [Moelleriella libera RCEF 2490]